MRHEKATGLLQLARELAASAEGMTLDEMASTAGVVRRSAERMRDALEVLFPQMEIVSDRSGRRYRIPRGLDGFFQAPTTAELAELDRLGSALRDTGHDARADLVEGLGRKIRSATGGVHLRRLAPDLDVITRAERSSIQAGPRPIEDPIILQRIRHAILALRAVSLRYGGGSRPGQWRTVCPCGVLFDRMTYLVAADIDGGEPRLYRLDRIAALEMTELTASPPGDFSLRAFADQSFGVYQDQPEDVVLRVTSAGAKQAMSWRFHPSQAVTAMRDGSVEITFRSGGMLELAWHLFSWGDQVRIIAPERLRRAMAEALAAATAALDAAGTTDSVAPTLYSVPSEAIEPRGRA